MCVALADPETADHRHPTAESSREEVLAFLYERNATLRRPRPICRDCRYPFDSSTEGSDLYRHTCETCGVRRLDRIVRRLIRRHGRRKTVKILKRLAK
jgi:hypothetical protein